LEAFLSSDLQRQAPSSCVIIISIQLRASSCRLVLLLQQQPEAFVSSGFCFDEPPRCILHKTSQILEACGETKKKKQQKPPLTRRRPCAGQQKPHDLPNAMRRKLLLCTHTPALESSCFNECFTFATTGNGRIPRFCEISLSLSLSLSLFPLPLSQINTLISFSLSGQHPNQTRERNFDIRCSILSMFFSVFEVSGRLQDLPEMQRSSGEYQSAMRTSTRTVFALVVVVVLVIVVVASKDSARPRSGS
jgi:hypothetical protein